MKRATRGDKPEWFDRPDNVVGVNVCRMSGKLPAGGCDNVAVVDRDGQIENRSMVYTEYFVKGTQPTEICHLHSPSFTDRLAGIFGKDVGMPISAEAAGLPPATTSTSGTPGAAATPAEATAENKAEEPKKKRGFWSESSAAAAKTRTRRRKRSARKPRSAVGKVGR